MVTTVTETFFAKHLHPHIQEQVKSYKWWQLKAVNVLDMDGSIRLCIDCQQLNAKARKEVFSVPWIDESLDALIGAK